ncbi:MAG: hypothetical protein NVSMB26_27380 [Beijerinckiaceae bacterium]
MRFAFGLLIGILITIGAAYLRDASLPAGAGADNRPLVNWDVADKSVKNLSETVREQWARLTGAVKREGKDI